MSFCYVAVKDGEDWGVREIYFGKPYSDDPKYIAGFTAEVEAPYGETFEELLEDVEQMLKGLKECPKFELIDGKLQIIEEEPA